MKNHLHFLSFFLIFGCGTEEPKLPDQHKQAADLVVASEKEQFTDNRFVSKDRKIEKIISDFEKPLKSYPTVFQEETISRKNGRLYRQDLLEEPFTGTVVENFPDGSLSLSTSYYRGFPHGQQIRNFPNGQRALVVNFDQGVLSGVKTRWWPNGTLREESYWSEAKYIGRRLWDRTGRLIKEEVVPSG